ncbi:MAG: DUF1569 domain-containing protein [Bacteroidota bacterium]
MVKSLYDKSVCEELINRLHNLTPVSEQLWGKMNVSQMLAHCKVGVEVAMGQKTVKRVFIGYLLGPLFKATFYNEKPFEKNWATADLFLMKGDYDFENEKNQLIQHIQTFSNNGPSKCTKAPHGFFGHLTPEQWGIGMYKHLDHHLRQFGV